MERYVDSLKHTGTGKDGIHNFCLKFGCRSTLLFGMRLMDAHMNCKPLPADINDGLFAFASNTDKDDDHLLSGEGIFRCPGDLRPLTLKNADNKMVAGITYWIIKPVVEKSASISQRGFVGDRQMGQNSVNLDYKSRLDALKLAPFMENASLS